MSFWGKRDKTNAAKLRRICGRKRRKKEAQWLTMNTICHQMKGKRKSSIKRENKAYNLKVHFSTERHTMLIWTPIQIKPHTQTSYRDMDHPAAGVTTETKKFERK